MYTCDVYTDHFSYVGSWKVRKKGVPRPVDVYVPTRAFVSTVPDVSVQQCLCVCTGLVLL